MNYTIITSKVFNIFKQPLGLVFILTSTSLAAANFNLPTTDSDGTFTFSWSGAGTYIELKEKIDGSFTTVWGQSSDSGSHTLTRESGIHTFELKACSVQGSQYGVSTSCSSSIKSITITPPETGVTYTYDLQGRLATVQDPTNGNRTYEYDAAGNTLTDRQE